MGDIQEEASSDGVDVHSGRSWLQRSMSDLERELIIQQDVMKEEVALRDLLIAYHENEMKQLNKKLVEELSIIRSLVEKQGQEVAELPDMSKAFAENFLSLSHMVELQGKKIEEQIEELAGMRNISADDIQRFSKLVQQRDCQSALSSGIGTDIGSRVDVESLIETPGIEVKETVSLTVNVSSDVAAIESSIASDVRAFVRRLEEANERLSTSYKQMLRDRDLDIESMKTEIYVLNQDIASRNEDVCQLRRQLAEQKLTISNFAELVEAKDETIDKLKDLLKLADEKLEEKVELEKRMEKMANGVEQLTQLIAPVKVNETDQMDGLHVVAESLTSVVSAWLNSKRAADESIVMDADLPGYLKRLRELYPSMTEKLSARLVAARLFQTEVLSLAELEKVQCSQTDVEAAQYLLNQILSKRCKVAFDSFLGALKATRQEHIFLWLTHDDYDIDSQHTDLIRQNYTFLLDHLDLECSELIALLFQEEVIDQRERECLECDEKGAIHKAEKLLSVLSRKSVEQFEKFLVALRRTGQDAIADELRPQPYFDASASSLVGVDVVDTSALSEDGGERSTTDSFTDGIAPSDGPKPANESTVQCVDSCPRLETSKECRVIASSEGRRGKAIGLTLLGNELFVGRHKQEDCYIEVYSAETVAFQRSVDVKELTNGSGRLLLGLTSCDVNNCLYVAVSCSRERYILKLKGTDGNRKVADKWKMNDKCTPKGLSVNGQRNLMVVCWQPGKLFEYSTHGDLIREVRLLEDVKRPLFTVQLDGNQYLVSSSDPLNRVCVVDADGRVVIRYTDSAGPQTEQLNEARQFAVDRNGLVFVADAKDHSIAVLDRSLNMLRKLPIDNGVLKKPYSLYLDELRNRLFIGEWDDDNSHVVVVTVPVFN